MRVGFIAFNQRKIVRNIRVQHRQLQVNSARLLLPVAKGLRADLVDLIRRIHKVSGFVMRLLRADIPDACILRRHHGQPVFNRLRIVAIGDVDHVQRMLHRYANHGVRQPFHVIHIAADRRIAEIKRQNMGQLIEIAFVDALATQ